jgi:hypothetical protein
MRFDLDLALDILKVGEDLPFDGKAYRLNFDDRPEIGVNEIAYHITLLDEAGLLVAAIPERFKGGHNPVVYRLTYAGHEFLEKSRSKPDRWEKAKDFAKNTLGSLTIEGMKIALDVAIRNSAK